MFIYMMNRSWERCQHRKEEEAAYIYKIYIYCAVVVMTHIWVEYLYDDRHLWTGWSIGVHFSRQPMPVHWYLIRVCFVDLGILLYIFIKRADGNQCCVDVMMVVGKTVATCSIIVTSVINGHDGQGLISRWRLISNVQ